MPTEATAVHPTWKIPCILFYQSKDMDTALNEICLSNPISSEVFLEDKSLAQRGGRKRITFIPLNFSQIHRSSVGLSYSRFCFSFIQVQKRRGVDFFQ